MRLRLSLVALAALLGGAGALALGACITIPPPPPEPCDTQIVTLDLYASDLINPNDDDRTRPVVVRLYQLGSDLKMLNAKYDDVLLREKDTLGADVLKVDEITVFPNDLVQVKFERIPEATLLAGVALFRSPQGQSWKTYYEFPPMPNTPEACKAGAGEAEGEGEGDAGAEAPQAYPKTAFFVVERKIDNGGQFDETMFPTAEPIRKIHLPKRSANTESAPPAPAP